MTGSAINIAAMKNEVQPREQNLIALLQNFSLRQIELGRYEYDIKISPRHQTIRSRELRAVSGRGHVSLSPVTRLQGYSPR